MRTPVYVKMDAHDQLLSEGVCRQLEILTYQRYGGDGDPRRKPTNPWSPRSELIWWTLSTFHPRNRPSCKCEPSHSQTKTGSPLYVKQTPVLSSNSEMLPEDVLLQPNKAGFAHTILLNPIAIPQVIAKGACVGEATPVALVDVVPSCIL